MTPEKLRSLLENHGISQREAARLIRVTNQTMGRWAAGKAEIPWAAGELLRRILTERIDPSEDVPCDENLHRMANYGTTNKGTAKW